MTTENPTPDRTFSPAAETTTFRVLTAAFALSAVYGVLYSGYQVGTGHDVEWLRIAGAVVAMVCAVICARISINR